MNLQEYEIFKDQLEEQAKKNSTICSSQHKELVNCAWQNLYKATQIHFKCLVSVFKSASQKEIHTIPIFTNALSDILCALTSTIIGHIRGPGTILRGVVENLGCAVNVTYSDESYSKYIKNRLDIPKQLTRAKLKFPILGELNGLLSNTFTHEQFETVGRCVMFEGEDTIHSILPSIETTDFDKTLLLLVAQISKVTGVICETCYQKHLEDTYYIHKTIDGEPGKMKFTFEDQLIQNCIKIENHR